MERLLIVEDDEGIRTQMKWALSGDYKVFMAANRNDALKAVRTKKPEVVILDLGLPPCEDDVTEGFACLKDMLAIGPTTKVVVVTGNDERENALQAIGLGAYDFYQKPVDLEVLKIILQRAFRLTGLEQEYRELKGQLSGPNIFEGMIGCSGSMQEVFATIKKVATTDATMLIQGESGTGKELVARAIHRRSLRKDSPFVPINCGSIPESLIESELFGYEKGAFTDAKARKIGLLERASGGSVFLDEIGELPKQLQVKLLRFIQERTIRRVGGDREIEIDLRIVAATNIDLKRAVKDGDFREDLFYRLNVITITLPPLRERGKDILILAGALLAKLNEKNEGRIKRFRSDAIEALKTHDWPGNVRELENRMQRAVILAEGTELSPEDLDLESPQASVSEGSAPVTLREARARAEIEVIQRALMLNGGKISKAAEILEVSRPTLHELVNKYGLKTGVGKS